MKSMVLVTAAVVALADALPGNLMSVASKHEHGEVAARYVKGVQQPIEPPTLSGSTIQGCYKSSGKLEFQKIIEWNTIGSCGNDLCRAEGFKVGGTTGGNQCWCGNTYPPKDDLVDSKNCDVGCTGFGDHACGGIDFWTIYHTGVTLSVKNDASPPKSTSSSDSPKATETESKPQETVVVTESPTSEPESDSSGPNVAGIAAGVVVGVVVIASAIGGGFLYMRRKRNQEIEEEHRRNAAVNAFIGKPPRSSGGTSTTDSRMDPVMAHRRMSDGSIADNQDYSRRILRVTNA
jgi:cell wall integrity and stress response component